MDLSSDSESEGSQFDSESSEEVSNLDRTLEVTVSPTRDDLVSLLECPVCFDLPLPPIRTCIQGHIICADCCCRLNKCPLCQQRIDIGRNFFAENFLNKSIMKCKYKLDGCAEELPGEKMKTHIHKCEFRPLKCKGCKTIIAFSEFEIHMLREHGIGRWDLNDEGVPIVKSHKQRKRHRNQYNYPYEVRFHEGPVSTKFLLTSLLITVVFTAFIDYWYGDSDFYSVLWKL